MINIYYVWGLEMRAGADLYNGGMVLAMIFKFGQIFLFKLQPHFNMQPLNRTI